MEKELGRIYGEEEARRVVVEYVGRVREYVGKKLNIDELEYSRDRMWNAEGKSLVALILAGYPLMSYGEIALYGYLRRDMSYYHVKRGYELLDKDKGFAAAFRGFKAVHRKLMDELFSIDIEEDWTEEKVRVMRVSQSFMYLEVGGKQLRIDMDDLKALGWLAEFMDRERGQRLLDKSRLIFKVGRGK